MTSENDLKIPARTLARSAVYGLLAEAVKPLSPGHFQWLKADLGEDLLNAAAVLPGAQNKAISELVKPLQAFIDGIDEENLALDFEFMFEPHGGLKCAPYELDHMADTPQHRFSDGTEMADIAGFYRAFGLEVSEQAPDRVDHLGVELEFMHFLVAKEADARENATEEQLQVVIDAQRKFLKDHLGRWMSRLKARADGVEGLTNSFYPALITVIEAFVTRDQIYLSAS